MADETPAQEAPAGIKMSVLAQYIRDMSFENILVQKGGAGDVTPDVSVQVNIDAKKRTVENQFEVIIKLMIKSNDKASEAALFLMELEYGGVFQIENVPEDQLHPFLLIECPRMLFPFVRRVVSDVTRDGGFPPLNLETIDFLQLYRAELTRRAEAEAKNATVS
ncbi:protein-export chaperone SecB [Nereida ignava]|jgi:preprotein translocase subunit SecB|uniref:Protein-export protein SecB n=1 Tax=Nereida ignava TaxID=282199 RepID=A0A0U1NK89_9RHOB|nr:protein-export chaperone SecB [Nereida ignava]CRK75164.1 Protein-export protein SecB [Nereida ignava]SFI99565.1 protein translocase subunit secB [Nereida ignava DSM 16309]